MTKKNINRRDFIKTAAGMATAVVGFSLCGAFLSLCAGRTDASE